VQKHPALPLRILNYSPITQFENNWNSYTKMCRGLIIDSNNKIIARPLPKFFNIGQAEYSKDTFGIVKKYIDFRTNRRLKSKKFEVYEKLDGCLGIGFFYNSDFIIASRGSFTSEVSKAANAMKSQYSEFIKDFDQKNTYVFEIICDDSKIVIDYNDEKRLVLLAVVNTASGKEVDIAEVNYPDKAEKISGINSINDLKKLNPENKEGFVIRYPDQSRLKFKFEEYKLLHYIVTGINNKDIWRGLMYECDPERSHISWKLDFDIVIKNIPDEFYDWYINERASMIKQCDDIVNEVEAIANSKVFQALTRKDKITYLSNNHSDVKQYVLSEIDNKRYKHYIMRNLEPELKKPTTI
jgi:RNA ligase